jgi:hypothetical protein
MPSFNLDLKYKKSEEYKVLSAMVLDHHPNMPEFLVDMAILVHKTQPSIHKGKNKNEPIRIPEQHNFVLENAVQILDASEATPSEATPEVSVMA